MRRFLARRAAPLGNLYLEVLGVCCFERKPLLFRPDETDLGRATGRHPDQSENFPKRRHKVVDAAASRPLSPERLTLTAVPQ